MQSEIFKFKLQNVGISVTVDDSFIVPNLKSIMLDNPTFNSMHYHAQYELFIVGDNPLVVLGETEQMEFKNCIVCIPPLFLHRSIRGNDYRFPFTFSVPEKNKCEFSDFYSELKKNKPIELKTSDCQRIYAEEILKQINDPSSISKEIITSLLKLIFYNIFKSNTNIKESLKKQKNDNYFLTIETTVENYKKHITLEGLAADLHLSPKQTSRIIRQHYKTTLSDLVLRKRLRVACNLLKNSSMTISDIVEYTNFPSESYFYVQFKKHFGCTPLKYRKNIIKESE